MSILDEIEVYCQRRTLFEFQATGNPRAHRVPEEKKRRLIISSGIHSFLESNRRLVPETQADFSDFVMGELIQVALHSDHVDCFMARLEEPAEEIWEIRIYDTEPQLRFYGRFAAQNIFVALMGPQEKSKFFRRRLNYTNIKQACTAEWNRLFSRYRPLCKGEDLYAYLSSNVDPA